MQRITTRDQLINLANELGVRPDWHEPDEQDVTIETHGVAFDNAGFWPEDPDRPYGTILEHYALILKDGKPVAAVNLATLFAWACGTRTD
jgi:hypothetical protein